MWRKRRIQGNMSDSSDNVNEEQQNIQNVANDRQPETSTEGSTTPTVSLEAVKEMIQEEVKASNRALRQHIKKLQLLHIKLVSNQRLVLDYCTTLEKDMEERGLRLNTAGGLKEKVERLKMAFAGETSTFLNSNALASIPVPNGPPPSKIIKRCDSLIAAEKPEANQATNSPPSLGSGDGPPGPSSAPSKKEGSSGEIASGNESSSSTQEKSNAENEQAGSSGKLPTANFLNDMGNSDAGRKFLGKPTSRRFTFPLYESKDEEDDEEDDDVTVPLFKPPQPPAANNRSRPPPVESINIPHPFNHFIQRPMIAEMSEIDCGAEGKRQFSIRFGVSSSVTSRYDDVATKFCVYVHEEGIAKWFSIGGHKSGECMMVKGKSESRYYLTACGVDHSGMRGRFSVPVAIW